LAFAALGLDYSYGIFGERSRIERLFRTLKRRTRSFQTALMQKSFT